MCGKIIMAQTQGKKYYGKIIGEQVDLYDVVTGTKHERVNLFSVSILYELPDEIIMKAVAMTLGITVDQKEVSLKLF